MIFENIEELHLLSMHSMVTVTARTGFMPLSWFTKTCCKKRGIYSNARKILYLCFFSFCIFREEYLICELACVISSTGGYIGIFFGVSILDIFFLSEWILDYLQKFMMKTKNI